MEFEFDSWKSKRNSLKHGIDFVRAQKIWDDPMMLELPARTDGEFRLIVIGIIESKCWSAVITHRQEKVRIISVRRSRKDEVELYENQAI